MKRHLRGQEGYVLPYVLAVLLAVSFVSAGLCSGALANLQAQEASIQRSQRLYEAEGAVEKQLARLQRLTVISGLCPDPATAEAEATAAFWIAAQALGIVPESEPDTTARTAVVRLRESDGAGSVTVTARVRVEWTLAVTETATEEHFQYQAVAAVAAGGLSWEAYDISHSAEEGGDGP